MIQIFNFDKTKEDDSEFVIITGQEVVKFFLKRVLYLILFFYSTLFLAVAIPFVKTPFYPIYFIGAAATIIYICRFINHIVQYKKYKNGKIRITGSGIEISGCDSVNNIKADEIESLVYNPLGNLVIKGQQGNTSFPVTLLNEEDRGKILSRFTDISPQRTATFRKIWEFIDAVVVALVLAVHIIQYVIQAYFIPTSSMEDTLLINDHLFVEKITFGPIIPQMLGMDGPVHLSWLGIRDIKRSDIVIFRPPHEKDKDYIKRCIAIPGDKLDIKEGAVFINDKKLNEPYIKGVTYIENKNNSIVGVVPEGKIVVFGDNRENSLDGRVFGYLDIEKVKGKAFILYWNTEQVKNFDFVRFGLIR